MVVYSSSSTDLNLLPAVTSLHCPALLVLQVSRVSLLYETAPMYVTEQPAFLNAALLARTDLPPLQLLYHCKQIEKQAGARVVLKNLQGEGSGGAGAEEQHELAFCRSANPQHSSVHALATPTPIA